MWSTVDHDFTIGIMFDGYLTSEEACARLGIKWRTLYNLSKRSVGFPQPIKIGQTLLWPADQLDIWRANHPARRRKPRRTDKR
jgi:predicted DNA-binding transcriptional regulator AlpA